MTRTIIFWVIFIAMIVGGIVADAPLNGTIGVAGLWAIASSFKARKDGGRDGRYRFGWLRFLLGLACLAAAVIITLCE